MISKPFFSIIIPIRLENSYLVETLAKLKKQNLKNYEVLVITDKISKSPNPALKRNIGAKTSKGKYLVFLDDDSYPDRNYLKNLKKLAFKYPNYGGFCGPALTPKKDNISQKASGLVHSSYLGSGGAGTYRNSIQKRRLVDDYPSVNLVIKKSDFIKIKGFDTNFWPGEDTILCLKLTKNLNKKILYHPSLVVFHHRRSVLFPHLKQISRYALHRGFFVKKFPQTSLKIGYFLPSVFLLYLLSLPLTKFIYPLAFYFILILYTFLSFLFKKNSLLLSIMAVFTIPITHLCYGYYFVKGLFSKNIYYTPHSVDPISGKYIGG